MEVTRYRVNVEHGFKYWLVRVPEIDYSTQARHLREVDAMARDLISVMADVPPDSFDLDIQIEVPESVRKHLDRAAQLRAEATAANSAAAAESKAAARELRDRGLPLRDVGEVLGVSYQRAHQLVS